MREPKPALRVSRRPLFAMGALLAGALGTAFLFAGVDGWRWAVLGGVCWVVGVVAKVPVGGVVEVLLTRCRAPAWLLSGAAGVNSALAELGVTALAWWIWRMPGGVGEAVAVGIGAGAMELVAVVVTGLAAGEENANGAAGRSERFSWSSVLERLLALVGHAASRGLVWVAVAGHASGVVAAVTVVLAVALFAIVDGTADYGARKSWDWSDRRTLSRYYVLVAVVTVTEVVVLAAASSAG